MLVARRRFTLRIYGDRVHVTDWSINVQHGPKFGFEKPTKTHLEISAFEQVRTFIKYVKSSAIFQISETSSPLPPN